MPFLSIQLFFFIVRGNREDRQLFHNHMKESVAANHALHTQFTSKTPTSTQTAKLEFYLNRQSSLTQGFSRCHHALFGVSYTLTVTVAVMWKLLVVRADISFTVPCGKLQSIACSGVSLRPLLSLPCISFTNQCDLMKCK